MPFHRINIIFLISFFINSIQSQSNIEKDNADIATEESSKRDQKGRLLY